MRKLFFISSILLCLVVWSSRLIKINDIIAGGYLADFRGYYLACRSLIEGSANPVFLAQTSFGPPFVLLPFLPFAVFEFKIAEYFLTLLNLLAYGTTFFLLWKKYFSNFSACFWFLLALAAFSFPLVFSLGMGNPIGLVTLGFYAPFLFKNSLLSNFLLSYATLLKIFPGVVWLVRRDWRSLSVAFVVSLALVFLLLPHNVWPAYREFSQDLFQKTISAPDLTAYNQSFSSTVSRFGQLLAPTVAEGHAVGVASFSLLYFLFAALIGTILLYGFLRKKFSDPLIFSVVLAAVFLLLHPFPWQHYYAVFLPYLFIKINQNPRLFLSPYFWLFLLLSFDGNRFPNIVFLKPLFMSSQFTATLIFLFLEIFLKTKAIPFFSKRI